MKFSQQRLQAQKLPRRPPAAAEQTCEVPLDHVSRGNKAGEGDAVPLCFQERSWPKPKPAQREPIWRLQYTVSAGVFPGVHKVGNPTYVCALGNRRGTERRR